MIIHYNSKTTEKMSLLRVRTYATSATMCNQSSKGSMWSAIPIALLCMFEIVGDTGFFTPTRRLQNDISQLLDMRIKF